jgi:hypothetical protein
MSQSPDSSTSKVLLELLETLNTVQVGVQHLDADSALQVLMELKAMNNATHGLLELTSMMSNPPAPGTTCVHDPALHSPPAKRIDKS